MGVPEITPVTVFTERPAGRPVALNAVGAFVAVMRYAKSPLRPMGAALGLVITGGRTGAVTVSAALSLATVATLLDTSTE